MAEAAPRNSATHERGRHGAGAEEAGEADPQHAEIAEHLVSQRPDRAHRESERVVDEDTPGSGGVTLEGGERAGDEPPEARNPAR